MKVKLIIGNLGFEAAHNLYDYEGDCARLHGHSYKLSVVIEGEVNSEGFVLDFGTAREIIKQNIIYKYEHRYLNDMFDFNPTAENMARCFAKILDSEFSKYDGVRLSALKLWETEHNCVEIIW